MKESISLRERKFAQTKLALLESTLERLEHTPFEDIAVRDLCAAAQISEPTFYNYFPRKGDLLVYFIQLWTIEVSWHARRAAGEGGGLAAIEAVFDFTAQQSERHPAVMGEIIAFQARAARMPDLAEITLAERRLAFPELDGVEDLPAAGLDSILPAQVQRAMALGELPRDCDVFLVVAALVSVFFGIPLLAKRMEGSSIRAMYRQQLHLLWAGVRAGGATVNNDSR